ncbi:hypothetical protein [Hoeflea marina]|uniref:hypothetical protein n=1 Tax=Hoeflea marina TaxID=274592 RepID=UPI0011B3D8B3|nr:hypothetical protein [Hoeflea marina]
MNTSRSPPTTPIFTAPRSARWPRRPALTHPLPIGAMSGKLVLGPYGFFDAAIFDPAPLDTCIGAQALHPHAV